MPARHSLAREGLIAGFLGATSVALWFLIVDSIAGRPLHTPTLLGTGLFSIFGPVGNDSVMAAVLGYTIFHYAAFTLAGIIAVMVVHQAEQEPSVLVVFMLLFIIFELGFYGVAAILAETQLGSLAWYQVAAGNVVAALVMGIYLWRGHPALRQEFQHALGGHE
ncbi:MAG TPA: hypothetical protein VJ672_16050 [Gemmatimonadaceae bacterium]|nr:hypothetical protein [Gemmatimonadaceae bacterium]